ncbi:MAG: hypothetical protein HY581_08740 [Nitrospirae bacterium]|nr:hypothetical protein [Nitrospirota bacterium]
MGQINWNRVLLGGIVAGLIIDVIQWLLHGLVLGSEWRQVMQALGKPLEENMGRILFYVVLGLVYGILAIGTYAAIRPRFGAGPKTALYAGLGVWLLGYCLPTLTWVPMGLFPRRLVAIAMVVGLVEILLATMAGAWLYQEPARGAETAARRAA